MALKNYLYANMMALLVSVYVIVVSLRFAAGEAQPQYSPLERFDLLEKRTKLSQLEDFNIFQNPTSLSGYLAIILVGLLLATVSPSSKKQKLAPGVPVVGGGDLEQVKQNRKRFIHDGKAMLAEGYRQVSWDSGHKIYCL